MKNKKVLAIVMAVMTAASALVGCGSTGATAPADTAATTGAGDSFNAGFVYGFLTGKGLEECLACGNACGALNVTAYGGNTGFPDKEGLKEFMEKKKVEETK